MGKPGRSYLGQESSEKGVGRGDLGHEAKPLSSLKAWEQSAARTRCCSQMPRPCSSPAPGAAGPHLCTLLFRGVVVVVLAFLATILARVRAVVHIPVVVVSAPVLPTIIL